MEVDILHAATEFYGLQAVEAMKKIDYMRHSHEKWREDFSQYKNMYCEKLAQMILDYTVLVVYGELRHSSNVIGLSIPGVPNGGPRSGAYEKAKKFTPVSIAETGVEVFANKSWRAGYGGEAWRKISLAALNRLTKPEWSNNESFIDHCVDLSHNSSPYFDKYQTNIFRIEEVEDYKDFLDFKREATPVEVLMRCKFSWELASLIERAVNLGILPKINLLIEAQENERMTLYVRRVIQYTPIEWGDEKLEAPQKELQSEEEPQSEEEYNGGYKTATTIEYGETISR